MGLASDVELNEINSIRGIGLMLLIIQTTCRLSLGAEIPKVRAKGKVI
ncbi:hypothetical protein Sbal223_3497 [Shewanella baltica OS223]|nr:hypothetical protein Sbal223_3497 [Shewanella baltica OS223]